MQLNQVKRHKDKVGKFGFKRRSLIRVFLDFPMIVVASRRADFISSVCFLKNFHCSGFMDCNCGYILSFYLR